jgi:hypothetical protein
VGGGIGHAASMSWRSGGTTPLRRWLAA